MNFLRKLRQRIRFYRMLFSIWGDLLKILRQSSKDMAIRLMYLDSFTSFVKSVHSVAHTKTTNDSLSLYQEYDDREQKEYESDVKSIVLKNGALARMTDKEVRAHHLSHLYSQLDQVLLGKEKIRVLEVGCGNCINIAAVLDRYGDRVELYGLDISDHRIQTAQKYFGERLTGAQLQVGSITERTMFDDQYFDVVFSMFCVEQIAYETKSAVREMYRIASQKLVMIEPVYENGSFMQKIGLIHADHVRILLKVLSELNIPPNVNKILDIQFNPNNQASMLVVDRNT